MANPWMIHLKKIQKSLPKGTHWGKAMKIAKKTYKKVASSVKPNKKHRRSTKKRRGGDGDGEQLPLPQV
jgi:hypothetical protein